MPNSELLFARSLQEASFSSARMLQKASFPFAHRLQGASFPRPRPRGGWRWPTSWRFVHLNCDGRAPFTSNCNPRLHINPHTYTPTASPPQQHSGCRTTSPSGLSIISYTYHSLRRPPAQATTVSRPHLAPPPTLQHWPAIIGLPSPSTVQSIPRHFFGSIIGYFRLTVVCAARIVWVEYLRL